MIDELPDRFIRFRYEIYNEAAKLINVGETQLVFIDAKTRKMAHAPQALVDTLKKYF